MVHSVKVMPTQDEIVTRLEQRQKDDFFGFETTDYVQALDYEHAKPYLKDGVTPDEWMPEYSTRDQVIAKMLDYMAFAWDKALDERGLSANRSIIHYRAWAWLAGDVDLSDEIARATYYDYGKSILRRVCEFYGWDDKQWST